MGVKFTGLDQALKQLSNIKDEVKKGKVMQKALVPMGILIREEAKVRAYKAPANYRVYDKGKNGKRKKGDGVYREFKPGTVAESIIVKKLGKSEAKGLDASLLITLRGEPKKFGNLLEYGSRNPTGAPMPFMRPAYDAKIVEAEQLGKDILTKEIAKLWK